jgi:hypothetical protein
MQTSQGWNFIELFISSFMADLDQDTSIPFLILLLLLSSEYAVSEDEKCQEECS